MKPITFLLLAACVLLPATDARASEPALPAANGAMTPLTDVFISGQDGYHTYRIPSLIVTGKGTVLAFCEGRKSSRSDAGDIDLVLKRSTDGGKTWNALQVVAEDGANTVGNPCPVIDRETGTIWLLLTHNLGTDTEAAILAGKSQDTRRVLVTSSADDGLTWTKPLDITATVKPANWTWYATGPGVGIQLKSGRLLIPCDNSLAGDKTSQSHTIYSDDHGKTWKLGGVVGAKMNECQAAELSDGSIVMNMRSYRGKQCRAVSTSRDGGLTWSEIQDEPALIEPICQASLISHKAKSGKHLLIFANPASTKREKMTLRISQDDGKTWGFAKLIYAGSSAYSSLTILPDGSIGCLFERDNYAKISLTRISWE